MKVKVKDNGEIFREGPVTILRRTDHERYAAFVERKRAMMKELYSKERRRMKLVLPRRTALHIPQVNYTKSQVLHRHNALKRGYVLAEDCSDDGGYRYVIFWDAGTRRSARFERNLAMDGFHVEEWKFG